MTKKGENNVLRHFCSIYRRVVACWQSRRARHGRCLVRHLMT